MSIWKRFFGDPSKERDETEYWKEFALNVQLHDSALVLLYASAGAWPEGVHPDQFSSANWLALVSRVRAYIEMPYPLAGLRERADAPRPTYKISDEGRIMREGHHMIDLALFQCKPSWFRLELDGLSSGQNPVAVGTWGMIEHYSKWPLARFVFSLPATSEAHDMASKSGKVMIVPEHVSMQIYMGVENTLFDVYEHLSEGARITDKAVKLNLQSLLNA